MSIELRLAVTETILCGFQKPIGQRRVATASLKLSGIDSARLQIQKRQVLSTNLRLTVAETIPI